MAIGVYGWGEMVQVKMDAALLADTFAAGQTGPLPPGQAQRLASRTRSSAARNTYNDDANLVEACLAGDEASWEKLVRRYSPLVYSIPRRLGLPTTDADDVLQTVFTIAFRRLSGLKNRRCLAAWLITITRRECLHHCRRTPENAELVDEITDGGTFLADLVEQQQRRLIVHQALSRLDPNSQALLSALFLEVPTPSYEAIAQRLGMAVGSIGPARARCLKKLEAALLALDGETFHQMVGAHV
jgi:RNA polymerase sigma factor (sigma-70 family)